ncbi:hypothetical protein NBO_32g0016 [Nosema bombycis CQ1]|uniref:Uncharacterized protein n=1 Tax=Nosema bombycis (strain CQ1 / CVCC 102059) TaxID=578461 RepID=R0KTV0_NOSB1|nr:hypothetical protein NBO_32g0016 [Nosema bombycis CQ1]|eukprot:EOB14241.1 hypothetical protein NBO_32g0016 [Nosema bombycis CQ1]
MKVSFKLLRFCIKTIFFYCHCIKNNILCAEMVEEAVDEDTYVFVQNDKDDDFENIENEADNKGFEYFTSFEFLQIPENTTENFQCGTGKEYLKTMCDKQKILIAKIDDILNKPRQDNDWETVDERDNLESQLDEFLSLTIRIRMNMLDSHLQLLKIYDVNLTLVFNNILSISNIKNRLNKKIKQCRENLLMYAHLKSTMNKTMIFYNEIGEKYSYQNKLFDETSKNIEKFKNTFDLSLKLIENILKKIKNEDFTNLQGKLQKILKMFDINQTDSLYKADKLINDFIEKSLIDICAINNSIYKYFHS